MDSAIKKCIVKPNQSLRDVMISLNENGLEIVMVIDDEGRLLGILTDGDVRRAQISGAGLESSIIPYIQRKYYSVSSKAERADVLDLMQARRISQVPIVDTLGKLVGLHTLHGILGASIKPNWAAIMAGGRGERLKPTTDAIPKPMIRVAGRPILERLVLHFISHGIRNFYLSVNYKADHIESYFGDGSSFGCKICYLKESVPLGTGGALSLIKERPSHPLIVCNGDLLTQVNISRLLDFHIQGGFCATIAYHDYSLTIPYGVLKIERDCLKGICEKPTETWKTNAGIYVLNAELLKQIPSGTYYSIPSIFEDCLKNGETVGAFPIEEDWIDIGCPQELRRALGEIQER